MTTIGYTVKTDSTLEKDLLTTVGQCQEIIQTDHDNYDRFAEFLHAYQHDQLVVVDFESIGLQLSQLAPLLEWLLEHEVSFHFMEKPVADDHDYLTILYQLAISEKEVVSRRTLNGLRVAHANGAVSGRPRINLATIKKIKYLHTYQRKNIRDIATECNVSLGTVHKYINLNEADL
ncbi:recombinase family protein [Vagococcus sp. BWB3-3]|uniref:Recombinase family protein n=1 Tax=Vagococcus allomyrinae TaxID=2794353 RepID=A0A940P3A0_9ENTE|nr:recombinase family protein [Vagococcus allomyrinae]MBP1040235.1 recombinase family protein [Vagococcus allomyrinae]